MDWKKLAPWNWFKEENDPVHTTYLPSRPGSTTDPFSALREDFERIFQDRFLQGFPWAPSGGLRAPGFTGNLEIPLRPSVDISEGKKSYTICAELPGIDKEDLSLDIDGHTLTIRAEKRQDREEDEAGYHWVERSYGAMQRTLSLPEDADADAINARFKNGVLKLRIPKHPAAAKSGNRIEIEAG